MSSVTRLCPECGHGNVLDARYCAHCGHDTQGKLPAPQSNLPAVVSKAALPVLVGAAGLALSAGWKLLQVMMDQSDRQRGIQVKQAQQVQKSAGLGKFSVRITTAWAVSDSSGKWQKGQMEHTIEFDE